MEFIQIEGIDGNIIIIPNTNILSMNKVTDNDVIRYNIVYKTMYNGKECERYIDINSKEYLNKVYRLL